MARRRGVTAWSAWVSAWMSAWLIAAMAGSPALAQDVGPPPPPSSAQASAAPKDDGFASFPKPREDLPFLDLEGAWPQRWGRAGLKVQGVVSDYDNPKIRLEGERAYSPRPITESVDAKALKQVSKGDLKPPDMFLGEGLGSFSYFPPDPDGGKPKKRANEPSMLFRFISGQLEGAAHDGREQTVVRLERTWFSVFDPIAAEDAAAPKVRGAALLMPGLFGTPEGTLSQLTTVLRKNGWVVVRMMSQPARFTERAEFEFNAGGDLEAQAERMAALCDNRTAECAYAAQAAFMYLEGKRPELKTLARIAIGFSGGAMTLPTVVAREPKRYSAAIMVGGGADFWLMNERSSYKGMIDAVRVKWDGEPPTEQVRARFDELYLRHAPLDSYHTAAVLKGKKVLMIQGTKDLAVPSPLGDLLWERMGKPERWLEEGLGHELLFMALPQKYGKMMEWLADVK